MAWREHPRQQHAFPEDTLHPKTPQAAAVAAQAVAAMLAAGNAAAQASFDLQTQQLSVPTIDVGGQVYRNLVARLDPDGRLTILSLTPPATQAVRIAAATAAAQSSSNACAPIRPFYWEIGDANGRQGYASVGVLAPQSNTPMQIY